MPPFFTSLPETVWAEVNRRLRVEPALWQLANTGNLLATFVKLGDDLTLWRPGQLGLLALAVFVPQSAPNPLTWLDEAGRERLALAYTKLTAPDKIGTKELREIKELPELVDATIAAVALSRQLDATGGFTGVAAEALAAPERWGLPLVCLYSLLDDPEPLVAALLGGGHGELVARLWIANESPTDLAGMAADVPPALRLPLARHLSAAGFTAAARVVAGPAKTAKLVGVGNFHELADSVESIMLTQAGGEDSARTALGQAVETAQTLTADLALQFGALSMAEGDPVSALAAFQEVKALRPHDRAVRPLIAEAKLACGQTRAALVELESMPAAVDTPRAHLAAARVHRALGNTEQALLSATAAVWAACAECGRGGRSPTASSAETLLFTAELFLEWGQHEMAAQALHELLAISPADYRAYLLRARQALAGNDVQAALDAGWQAVGLAPGIAATRQVLAEALSKAGDFVASLAHWQRAVTIDPRPATQAKLAEAALAAGQAELALEVAHVLLGNPGATDVNQTGLPHIIAGRALSALGQPDQAFEHFNQATALAPHSAVSWRAVAAHHREQGDAQGALAALEAGRHAVGKTTPEAAELYADLGELLLALNQPAEAVAAFEKAAKILPERWQWQERLGELYRAQKQFPAAIEALRRAAIGAASDSRLWHLLGQTLEAAGQTAEALAAYQHAHASHLNGTFVELFRDLGRLAYRLGQLPVARSALEAVLKNREANTSRDDLESLTLLGAIYEQAGDFVAAREIYKRAIALDSTRSDLGIRLGVCCLELGQPEAAIALLKDAAERDLDDLGLQKMMGQAYAAAQLWDEAGLAYQQAIRLAPGDHSLFEALAKTERMAGHIGEAVNALRQAIALAPEHAGYLQSLADLLAATGTPSHLAEARELYRQARRLAPESFSIALGLGHSHLMLNEVREAADMFEKATALDPRRAEAQQALGEINLRLEQYETAHTAFARAAELEPGNPIHLRQAGECLWQSGERAAAVATWRKLLATHPNETTTLARLGAALTQQGRYTEALDALEQAATSHPANAALALEAARAAICLSEFSRALNHLERAAKATPNDPEVWQLIGQVCVARGAPQKALAAYQRAVQLAPNDGRPLAALAQLQAESGNLPEALLAAETALNVSLNDLNVLAAVSEVFATHGAGRLSDAVALSRKVAEGRSSDPGAQLALARILTLAAEANPPGFAEHPKGIITQTLERAAALGADTAAIREWAGRAAAVGGNPGEAIPLLESAAPSRPSSDLFRVLAGCYRQTGRPALARQAIHSALERAPTSLANLIELGQVCLAQGDRNGARAAFERAVGLDSRQAKSHQLLAETLLGLGERIEAMAEYSQALALDPAQAAWHHRLAVLYESRRDTASALAHYQRAATLAVDASRALPAGEAADYLAALARAYARDADFEAARKQFEAALALRDDVPAWWAQCGEINFTLRRFARAFDCYQRACELQPDDTASLIGAARAALALGREGEAEEKAISVLRFDPDNTLALIAMGEIFARREDLANAIFAYTRAADRAADSQLALQALAAKAQLLITNHQLPEAIAALKHLHALDPDDDEGLGLLGDVLAENGDSHEALQVYQEAARIAPRKATHHLRLGRLCRAQGQLDAALGHLQQARELEADNTNILREVGLVFEARRQFDRAYQIYESLIQLEPDLAENFFRGGIALKALRDYAQAAHLFQRAAELDPGNIEAERQRLAVSALGILSNN
jgi:tetratricopeptide (TPR) repeat protein